MKHITEIIKEITDWKKVHSDAVFYAVKCIPRNLQFIIEAIADNGTYEGVEKKFVIPLLSINKWNISPDQYRIVQRLMNAREELHNAEIEFIKLFTSEIN